MRGNCLTLAAAAALGAAAAGAKEPLAKTGPCPTLDREPFAMDARFDERFITGNSLNVFIKDPAKHGTIQKPLTPAQSVNCHEAPAGLKVQVWTDETEANAKVVALQAFTFDERGRMWAVETFDYPNTIKDPFQGGDRVVILEDTDGDGVADRHKVFVTGLNIPQGIEIVPEGVVVAMSPHLVLFEDKNGDDVADVKTGKIIYTGFHKGDTHGGVNSLRYGVDGWLYGMVGYNKARVGNVTMTDAGMWRVRTDETRFEIVSYTAGGNAAGMGIMEDGQLFASSANGKHTQHAALYGSVIAPNISAYGENFAYKTLDLVQGDWRGAFTAASDHEIYTARLLPKPYWNRAAFVSEGTGHLVNLDLLAPKGSTWSATRNSGAPNIFASTDAWSAPIMTKTGPDGAVWVLDWYTYIYLHNGIDCAPYGGCAGAAWPNPLRNRTRQRLYRVLPADKPADPLLNLSSASLEQLVGTFSHTNLQWRLMAQRLLLRRHDNTADKAKLGAILSDLLTRSRYVDDVGIDPVAIHALWTAQNLGLFANAATWDPILKGLLRHPAPSVRRNTVLAMPLTAASVAAIKESNLAGDGDAHVRLAVMMAVARMPAGNALPVWVNHRNLDDLSKQAFTRAGANVTESATALPAPVLDPKGNPVVALRGHRGAPRLQHLRFRFLQTGEISPEADGRLEAGSLKVYDLHGRLAAEADFDGRAWTARRGEWRGPLHVYVYRGVRGLRIEGKLPPLTVK